MGLCASCPTAEMVQALVLDDRLWAIALVVTLALVLMSVLGCVAYGFTARAAPRPA